ncbi:hypothetical protein TRICI_001762 [Trichomonascus ciferrii]|uniref:acetyl-CoA C-acetyltransferase n=1 Tax=Trichomonascus ciferrii TaxID=44093 RepID=A0A642V8G8_9ASCO|nr:hypothetical protein TRICI_001762 [Trichomonascus ciferrii]
MQRIAARRFSTSSVYILSASRTPIGNFGGALKSLSGTDLGVHAAKAAIQRANIDPQHIEDCYFGNVLPAGLGQAPARQVVLGAGLPETTEATTVNKVCASGLKTVSLAAQAIALGDRSTVLAGGMESMSNAPFYLQRTLAPLGNQKLTDAIVNDGLWDVYNQIHMGSCCENTNRREGFSRQDQDNYAIESYKRALAAQENGAFKDEIAPVTIKGKKGDVVVSEDEAPKTVKFDSLTKLRPAFEKDGTVTAGNASSINDGAAALVLASGRRAADLGSSVLGRVVAYADAATAPIDFTIAPSKAIPIALERAGLKKDDIALWELNEAFAGVSLANNKILGLDPAKVNVNGGAVALGHPIGASGARILVTLLHSLKEGEYGVAGICNGGGAATALVVQKTSKVEPETGSKL